MSHTYQPYLEEVGRFLREELGEGLRPPSSEDEIEDLRRRSNAALGASVPDPYAELLRITNGLDWNGFMLYASHSERTEMFERDVIDGYVEMNSELRSFEPFRDYLFFAAGEMTHYVYNLVESRYEELSRDCGELLEVFGSFDAMLTKALYDLCEITKLGMNAG